MRDPRLLEEALFRPQTRYYSSSVGEAATLWESVSQKHRFVDRKNHSRRPICILINDVMVVTMREGLYRRWMTPGNLNSKMRGHGSGQYQRCMLLMHVRKARSAFYFSTNCKSPEQSADTLCCDYVVITGIASVIIAFRIKLRSSMT